MSDPEAVVRCIRVDQLGNRALPGSEIRPCDLCGTPVWTDPWLLDEITAELPDHRIVLHCRECVGDGDDDGELRITPGQVHRLRAQGADDEDIAQLFAVAEIAGATGSLDAVNLEIATYPHGETAQRFRDELDRTRAFVALTPRPTAG